MSKEQGRTVHVGVLGGQEGRRRRSVHSVREADQELVRGHACLLVHLLDAQHDLRHQRRHNLRFLFFNDEKAKHTTSSTVFS